MTEKYYHKRGDQIRGPFTIEKLRDLQAEGKLRPSDRLSVRDDGGWRSIEETLTAPKSRKAGNKQSIVTAKRSARTVLIPVGAVILALLAVVGLWKFTGSPAEQPTASTPVSDVSASTPTTIPVVAMARPPEAVVPFSEEQAKLHQSDWAKYLGVPVEWTNSIGIKFQLIPPGRFVWPPGQEREFILADPYYLGVTEVTVGEFGQVMDFVFAEDKRHFPRADITAPEAMEFCDRLSAMEALKPGYRLAACPESEFAALGGREATWRPTDAEYGKIAWYFGNWEKQFHPVAQKLPSPFGIFDLYGNVWELHDGNGGFRGPAAENHAPSQYEPQFLTNQRWDNGPNSKGLSVGFRAAIGLNADVLKPNANGTSLFIDNRKDRDDAKPLPPVSVLRRAIEAFARHDQVTLKRLVAEAESANLKKNDNIEFRKVKHLMNLLESPVPAKLGEISKGTPSVRVADIAFDKQKVGWGEVLRNRTFEHTPTTDPFLHVGGVFFESGMIAHADSRLELKLDGEWSTFSTKFGIQDGRATGSVVFVINGDGKELFRSEITNPKKIGQCNVDIRNITLLELITEGTPDGSDYDWSVWLEPTLHREASSAQSPPPTTEQPGGGRSPASSTHSVIDASSWGPSYGEVVEMIQTMPGGSVSSRIDRDGRSIGSFKIDRGEAILTDDHLRLLSGLSGIIEVDLGHNNNFSIPGIKQLGRCKGLQSFSIGHYSGMNDEFLSVFEGSENLRALKIGGRHITDRGVYSLSKIPQLKKLKLTHCEITDDAIRTLAKLKFLEELRLVACPFRGDGLTAFSGHDQLKVIELRLCKALTADRVMALRHVRSLKEVQLTETTLPASVGEQLRKARSDLLVNHSPVEPAMERMLRKRVPVMDFPGNTPLTEVLDHLVRSFGSFDDKLKFEFAAVGPRGLSLSQSNSEQWNAIDFKLLGGTLGEALERVLESVPNEDLTFSILDNAIVIRRK